MKITIEIPDVDIKDLESAAEIRRVEDRTLSPVSRLVISIVELIHRQQKAKTSSKKAKKGVKRASRS